MNFKFEHPHFTIPALDFRGTPVGIDLRKIVELGVTPRVNTGIAHREAGIGQVLLEVARVRASRPPSPAEQGAGVGAGAGAAGPVEEPADTTAR